MTNMEKAIMLLEVHRTIWMFLQQSDIWHNIWTLWKAEWVMCFIKSRQRNQMNMEMSGSIIFKLSCCALLAYS